MGRTSRARQDRPGRAGWSWGLRLPGAEDGREVFAHTPGPALAPLPNPPQQPRLLLGRACFAERETEAPARGAPAGQCVSACVPGFPGAASPLSVPGALGAGARVPTREILGPMKQEDRGARRSGGARIAGRGSLRPRPFPSAAHPEASTGGESGAGERDAGPGEGQGSAGGQRAAQTARWPQFPNCPHPSLWLETPGDPRLPQAPVSSKGTAAQRALEAGTRPSRGPAPNNHAPTRGPAPREHVPPSWSSPRR